MEKFDRGSSLPKQMQGHWTDLDDPNSELIISGGEVVCFGQTVDYDYKLIGDDDGAVTVSLKIDDASNEDNFQRSNVTELVVTPEGDFHAYNTRFASQFVRKEA
ncbi:hypothetical protein [Sphingopyxis solisilvae]|uniref:hypothetical protein n=1 Tax=Sphingopyxis solisilvae TaxID=1886788 RepID=UPI001E489EB1|nr:hypothetical protein [Sphingopyxis solisilvae]